MTKYILLNRRKSKIAKSNDKFVDWMRKCDFQLWENNEEFMKTLRKKIKIPFGIASPVWLLEIMSIFLKTETELLLKSRNTFPKKLIDSGFNFKSNFFE